MFVEMDTTLAIVLVAFPFVFAAFWLAITQILAALSGWNGLQDAYPDRGEQPVLRLRMQSGQLGKGSPFNPWGTVSYSGCLGYDVCPGGLRVSVWKIFGFFQRPFFVPWGDITVTQKALLFWTLHSLKLGSRSGVTLTIGSRAFKRIAAASPLAKFVREGR